ncbi:cytochrome P450 [Streptomyces griseochromogenes]|uniref:Cytochrome n=1 Tax=Streptomyces griseochromogenes TaxID=68214 RepID=A0A1B1B0P8_9ACTN|nr:cytochrome P450 [Streptomyces griseochromogenes]ANP52406.1 cytochrome [Streptomyces griseochromogenes]MBP2055314.1 cytochrome P450 [Streptomyces griseochromogenes]
MTSHDTTARSCPFDFADGLEFDPSLAALAQRGPVSRIRLPYGETEAWLVTSFAGVRQVTCDPRFSRAAIVGRDYPRMTPEPIVSPESINVADPPHATRLRHVAAQAFTRERVAGMRPAVDRVVAGLLTAMAEAGPPADLVTHLSVPLPHLTICELLAVPESDRDHLRTCTMRLLATSPDTKQDAADAKAELRKYFADLIPDRRRAPGEDLLSAMAAAPVPEGEEPLSDDELAVLAVTLILSGNDTATCQISNIAYLLLTRPEERSALEREPARFPDALEELLRFIPFRKGVGIPRIALEDAEVEGTAIRAGDYVHVSYLAANRDPVIFPDPHTLDLERPAHPHMTFGWGGHHCLAAPLARAELDSAVTGLLTRFPHLRLDVDRDEIQWDTGTIRRFPIRLPVTW